LWRFGFGLSYTTFELTDLHVEDEEIPTSGGELVVSAMITNLGERVGDEVVQLYCRDVEATVARPILELRGFRRVSLSPGERRRVEFRVGSEQFAYTGMDHRRVVEPGNIELFVGTSSNDLPLQATVRLVGPTVHVVERQRFLTETVLD
jgi:beta-glucosidase